MTIPTGGQWVGKVGSTGFILSNWKAAAVGVSSAPPANDVVSLPTGMTYTLSGASGYQFLPPEASPPTKAVENAAGTQGAAGCWFNNGVFSITISCASGEPFTGTVSVYAVDYDNGGRNFTVSDGTTTQAIASASAGVWRQFTETIQAGSPLTLTFTPTGGDNQAMCFGVFLDAAGSPPPPPGTATVSAVDENGNVETVTITIGQAPPPAPTPEGPPVISG